MSVDQVLVKIDDFIWGIPLIILIMGVGIILTVGLKGIQFKKLPLALKYMLSNEDEGSGDISSFAALCTALSASIGTGNIVGVATAIVAGGPGALFWMEIAAIFGMATKYAEGVLAVKYRIKDQEGKILGGPFYYIENGMGPKWRWLAKMFAIFGILAGLLGIGSFTQVNGITNAAQSFFDPNKNYIVTVMGKEYPLVVMFTGAVITIAAAAILLGGVTRIAKVAEIIVPAMIVIYVSLCIYMILLNFKDIPAAIQLIFQEAFGLRAVSGGALGAMIVALQKGVARGIFSNESGLGSAPIASAAARTSEPVRQGLVSMTGTFIDTIVVCTMTGLAIVLTNAWQQGLDGIDVTSYAFSEALPFSHQFSSFILMVCLSFFAFTTILGWDYYSERCLSYLTNANPLGTKIFRITHIVTIFIGPYMTLSAVWTLADIFNGLMALPNLIALFVLAPVVFKETTSYFARLQTDGSVVAINQGTEPIFDKVNID